MTGSRPLVPLDALAATLDSGGRLGFEEGLALYEHPDLLEIGRLANRARERRWGDRAFYTVNLHINPANSCVGSCAFCAFGRKPFDPGAYVLSPEAIVERARRVMPPGCLEIHLVGGLDPRLTLDYYLDYIRALKRAFPAVHVKTLTPTEVWFIAEHTGLPVETTLDRLLEAGMDSMPGGGAEIFDAEIRTRLCPHKGDAERWFAVHRHLHARGVASNCTMLYGHIEEARHRVDHLLRLRDHQDTHGGFNCFVPLAFHPAHTALDHLPGPTAALSLKTVAVARLLLDNIPHIKAYWVSLGLDLAQTALWFGADDFDGTVTHEEIHHDAGSRAPRGLETERIETLIREAGRAPVLRDAVYREAPPSDHTDSR